MGTKKSKNRNVKENFGGGDSSKIIKLNDSYDVVKPNRSSVKDSMKIIGSNRSSVKDSMKIIGSNRSSVKDSMKIIGSNRSSVKDSSKVKGIFDANVGGGDSSKVITSDDKSPKK